MAELRAEIVSVSTGRDAHEQEVAEALVSAIRATATTTYE
jgi:hypothetical protein